MVFPDGPQGRDWMRTLADHYANARRAHPSDELCIVFDIDGTILDLRHLVTHTLLAYDREQGTRLFHGIVPEDVTVPENQIEELLERLGVPDEQRDHVAEFYRRCLWDEAGIVAASAPYRGVLSVIHSVTARYHTSALGSIAVGSPASAAARHRLENTPRMT